MRLAFDCGCNRGHVTEFLLTQGFDKVIAVDGNPAMQVKFTEPNVVFLNNIVTNVSGQLMDFYLSDYDVISSASIKWVTEGRFVGKKKWYKTIKVPTTTLDDLIKTYGKPELIKIDVEGGELNAIKGLHHKVPLICWEWSEEIFDDTEKIVKHLKKLGYKYFSYTNRDCMLGYDNLSYMKWEDLEIHKNIKPERKYRWGMAYSK